MQETCQELVTKYTRDIFLLPHSLFFTSGFTLLLHFLSELF